MIPTTDTPPPTEPPTRHLGPTPASAAADFRKTHYEQSWLVAIGIDDYGAEHPPLYNARRDAQAITAKLRDDFGFQHVTSLCDAEATQDGILHLLRDVLPELVGTNDRVVIFVTVHSPP